MLHLLPSIFPRLLENAAASAGPAPAHREPSISKRDKRVNPEESLKISDRKRNRSNPITLFIIYETP
jgi:hypothetical protein